MYGCMHACVMCVRACASEAWGVTSVSEPVLEAAETEAGRGLWPLSCLPSSTSSMSPAASPGPSSLTRSPPSSTSVPLPPGPCPCPRPRPGAAQEPPGGGCRRGGPSRVGFTHAQEVKSGRLLRGARWRGRAQSQPAPHGERQASLSDQKAVLGQEEELGVRCV